MEDWEADVDIGLITMAEQLFPLPSRRQTQ